MAGGGWGWLPLAVRGCCYFFYYGILGDCRSYKHYLKQILEYAHGDNWPWLGAAGAGCDWLSLAIVSFLIMCFWETVGVSLCDAKS